jgi:hypothetical protein
LKKFLFLVTAAILNGGRSEQKVTTLDKDLARNSSLKYIPGFTVKYFFQPIYTDYAN